MDDVVIKSEAPQIKVETPKKDNFISARLAASFFDNLIFIACIIFGAYISRLIFSKDVNNYITSATYFSFWIMFGVGLLLYLVINVIITALFGGSIGKLLFKLRVVDIHGKKAGYLAIIVRQFVIVLPLICIFTISSSLDANRYLPFWFPLINISLFLILILNLVLHLYFDRKKSSFNDYISKTSIIKTKPSTKFEKVSIFFFAFLGGLLKFIIIFYLLASGTIFYENGPRVAHAQDAKIKNDVGALGEELDFYKGEYGQYPRSIEVLVNEGQIKRVPDDDGKPYNYIVTQNGSSAKISQKLHYTSGYWCWKPGLPEISKLEGSAKEVQSEAECQP